MNKREVLALFAAPPLLLMLNPTLEPIQVSDFDRQEIKAVHNAAQKLIERRNILISHVAKRHNVNLEEYNYEIKEGVFIPHGKEFDITSPGAAIPDIP